MVRLGRQCSELSMTINEIMDSVDKMTFHAVSYKNLDNMNIFEVS